MFVSFAVLYFTTYVILVILFVDVCMFAEGRTPEYKIREEYCILSVRKIRRLN